MPIYNFGAGNMVARQTGVSNPTPVRFGVLQDVDVSFDRTLKELIGQYMFPVDIAGAAMKLTGKVKMATIYSNAYNTLFFGQTVTPAAGLQMAVDESHTVPSTPYQVTIAPTGSGVFLNDAGVFYSVGGAQLSRVASAPAIGQYTVVEATGVYTFAAADAAAVVLISYEYTAGTGTTLVELPIANQMMGSTPTFLVELQANYTNNGGVAGTMNIKFNACKSSKLSLPFKNQDYTIQDFDFQAFADSSGNIGTMTFNV